MERAESNPPSSGWSALMHELKQPLTAMLSNAQAAQRHLTQERVDLGELRAILDDIVADNRRAAETLQRLGVLLKARERSQS